MTQEQDRFSSKRLRELAEIAKRNADPVFDPTSHEISAALEQAVFNAEACDALATSLRRARGICAGASGTNPRYVYVPDQTLLDGIDSALALFETLALTASDAEARESPPSLTQQEADGIISSVLRDVAELPDRTSPEGQPEMCLVSAEELSLILVEQLSPYIGAPPSAMGEAELRRQLAEAQKIVDTSWPVVEATAEMLEKCLGGPDGYLPALGEPLTRKLVNAVLATGREIIYQRGFLAASKHTYPPPPPSEPKP